MVDRTRTAPAWHSLRQCLLKWLGWPHEHIEWEREELDNCQVPLEDYLERSPVPWDAQAERTLHTRGEGEEEPQDEGTEYDQGKSLSIP